MNTQKNKKHGRERPVIFQGLEVGIKMFRWVVLGLFILFLITGIQNVQSGNVGLLLRFGRLVGNTPGTQVHSPGLVLAWPAPIDELKEVPDQVKEVEAEIQEVWRPLSETVAVDKIDPTIEGYCITGDQNIVQIKAIVKFRIDDPIRYKLMTNNPDGMLADLVLSSLSQTVAQWKIDDVLNLQREPTTDTLKAEREPGDAASNQPEVLAEVVQQVTQEKLDQLNVGIKIAKVEFTEKHPPRHVISAFRKVQGAKIAIETMKNEAEGRATRRILQAKADRNTMVDDARKYAAKVESQAKADASVFNRLHEEYKKNPEQIRNQLRMETLNYIIRNVSKLNFLGPKARVIISDSEVEKKP